MRFLSNLLIFRPLRRLWVDARIILTWILRKQELEYETVNGIYVVLRSIQWQAVLNTILKGKKYLDHLNECQLLMNGYCMMLIF
jgi:hypothetical protein